mgnify:CR=1
EFELRLSVDAKRDLQDFCKTQKTSQTSFMLSEPNADYRFVFDNKAKDLGPNIEVVNQFHPAIRFVNSMLL